MAKWLFIVAAIYGCASASVVCQTATGAWTLGPNWTYNRNISNQELARIAISGEINKRLARGRSGRRTATLTASGVTAFPKPKAWNLPERIANEVGGASTDKTRVRQAVKDALDLYSDVARKKGFPDNDLAFAVYFYFINNYVIYRNIDPAAKDVSGATQYLVGGFYSPLLRDERAVYSQILTQMRADTAVKAMSAVEKHEAAELLAFATVLMWQQFQVAAERRDMAALGGLRRLASSNVEAFTGRSIGSIGIGKKGIEVIK